MEMDHFKIIFSSIKSRSYSGRYIRVTVDTSCIIHTLVTDHWPIYWAYHLEKFRVYLLEYVFVILVISFGTVIKNFLLSDKGPIC